MILEKENAAQCARINKIHLQPEEIVGYDAQLTELFGWVEELAQVDTSAISEPNVPGTAYLRPDQPIQDEVLSNTLVNAFNEQEGHCAKVKKVL